MPQLKSSDVEDLRNRLQEKPQSVLLHSKLARVLFEYSKRQNDEKERTSLNEEAISLANRAIELAPERPAGYGALATVAAEHKTRMEAISRAVELEQGQRGDRPPTVGMALALVRLLTEPREEEAKVISELSKRGNKTIGRASAEHPNRRDLSQREQSIYQQLRETLDKIRYVNYDMSEGKEHLGWIEYRLGVFFRKLQPESKHQPTSMHHFRRTCEVLSQHHALSKKSSFWLATMGCDKEDSKADQTKIISTIERCPEEYIVGLYKDFADNFDNLLVKKLHYETPHLLRNLVEGILPECLRGTVWARNAADLGCGTGLSGEAFQTCCESMIGVDLSPEMINKANDRNCYNRLVVGDVEAILNTTKYDQYDLIFACDVFVYIGDLSSIFAAANESLNGPSGLFAFSTEFLEEDCVCANGYLLHKNARFAHKLSYIEAIAKECAFEIKCIKICPIRKNEGKEVKGILTILGLSQ